MPAGTAGNLFAPWRNEQRQDVKDGEIEIQGEHRADYRFVDAPSLEHAWLGHYCNMIA